MNDHVLNLRKQARAENAEAGLILAKATKEKRDLAPQDEQKWREHCDRADELACEAAQAEVDANNTLEPRQCIPPDASSRARDYKPGETRLLAPSEKLEQRSYNLEAGARKEDLSLGRTLRGIVTGNWVGEELEQRAMSVGDATLGGFTVHEAIGDRMIDLARAQAVTIRAGAQTIPMETAEMVFPRLTADPSTEWLAENAAGTFSDLTFGSVRLRARTLSCMVRGSIELFEDSQGIEQFVEETLSKALALELDRVVLRGSGGDSEPVGVVNTAGVLNIAKGATTIGVFDDFSDAVEDLRSANVTGPLGCVYHPVIARSIDKAADTTNQPLQPPPSWGEVSKLTTTAIPANLGAGSDETEIYLGDFSNVWIGMRR